LKLRVVENQRQIIQTYGDGAFKISDLGHTGSVIVTPLKTLSWNLGSIEKIDIEEFSGKLQCVPGLKILLLGTGRSIVAPPPELRTKLRNMGTSLEVMDTGAACRTFNILVAEERLTAAALIPI